MLFWVTGSSEAVVVGGTITIDDVGLGFGRGAFVVSTKLSVVKGWSSSSVPGVTLTVVVVG